MHVIIALLILAAPDYSPWIPCNTYNIDGHSHKVCWTFDDHPNKNTPALLSVLKKHQIRATFFVVSWPLYYHFIYHTPTTKKFLSYITSIVGDGHVLGNHSLSHANLCKASPAKVRREIELTQKLVKQYTGIQMKLWRPPHALLCRSVQKIVAYFGLRTIMFHVSDYRQDGHKMWRHLRQRVRAGHQSSTILMHDNIRNLRQLLGHLRGNRASK